MSKYRKKPVVVEARQYTGNNKNELLAWINAEKTDLYDSAYTHTGIIVIKTLEGEMNCIKDDWVIKGIKGEFYPCKPDIFERTYELYE